MRPSVARPWSERLLVGGSVWPCSNAKVLPPGCERGRASLRRRWHDHRPTSVSAETNSSVPWPTWRWRASAGGEGQ